MFSHRSIGLGLYQLTIYFFPRSTHWSRCYHGRLAETETCGEEPNILWTLIAQNNSEEFPNLLKLASLALTHPVHTADCERAFSNPNLVTTALQNRLSAEHIQQLMLVNIEGDPLDQFNFVDAVVNWRSSKKRSIFNHWLSMLIMPLCSW